MAKIVIAKLDDATLAKRVTGLIVRAETLRVAFNKSGNSKTGAQYLRVSRELGVARTAQKLRA